ncbi:MAG: amidase [Planctomycetota bacterium]|jgi:fatty acid amide hydrolase 2|nr:amidase [Planctomycetota bacterium]MDP6763617.1 amidase [Planctomycetota bacterium]MDP6989724.1 amidase [Planctomycetota bacterium]
MDSVDHTLLTRSATVLARWIAGGEESSEEIVSAHIRRIRQVNPALNALVNERFEEALEEARAVDRAVAAAPAGAEFPPFYGVPFSLKECIPAAGQPHTSALVARSGMVAERDAPAVARMRAAGGILLGVSNLSEAGFWIESVNRVYGRTGNAYDPRRTCGGSSGGEGALVGSGCTPIGIGSDIGGSIRIPAFFNGVFGHKPSGGLGSIEGHQPMPNGFARRYLCIGPLARHAEDLWPLLEVLTAEGEGSPAGEERLRGDPAEVDLGALRLLHWTDTGMCSVSRELRETQDRWAAALVAGGMSADDTPRPATFARAFAIWTQCMREAAADVPLRVHLGAGEAINPWKELLLWTVGRSRHSLPPLVVAAGENLPLIVPRDRRPVMEEMAALRAELNGLLGRDGVLLFPSYADVAPRHRVPLLRPFQWLCAGLFNILELPVTQVPLGLGTRGLPLGVQVVAAHGNDELTIAVASELERLVGGWRPPFEG